MHVVLTGKTIRTVLNSEHTINEILVIYSESAG